MRHLALYQAVRTIAAQGSLRKASELLKVSPATLSRQLAALEQDLGAELFERTTGGLRLTSVGELYHRQFSDHLAQMQGTRRTALALAQGQSGVVRVVVAPEWALRLAPRLIAAFRADLPRVTVHLLRRDGPAAADALAGETAEVALVAGAEAIPEAEVLAARDMPLVFLSAQPGPVGTDRLIGADLALPGPDLRLRALIDAMAQARRLPLAPGLVLPGLTDPALLPSSAVQVWPDADVPDAWRWAIRPARGLVLPDLPLRVVLGPASAYQPAAQRLASTLARGLD
jgi:DNA-binding transcriptional LysR family regulator